MKLLQSLPIKNTKKPLLDIIISLPVYNYTNINQKKKSILAN